MAERKTTPPREEEIRTEEEEEEEEDVEEEEEEEEEEANGNQVENEDIGECLVSEETNKINDTSQGVVEEEEEDGSHKRKHMNDDEDVNEVIPAKKKSYIKPGSEEVEKEEVKNEETLGSCSSPMSVSGSRGVSKFGFQAMGMSGIDQGITDEIDCPAALIGRLIGKQGETIKYLQGETNTKLQIDHKAQGDVKKVLITGTTNEAVTRVKALIKNVLDSESGGIIPGEITEMVDCPQGIVGRVIGRHGETIRALQGASHAKIVVEQNFPDGVPRKVKISGKPDVVDLAVKMVSELISGEHGSAIGVINKYTTNPTASRVVECPKSMIGRVIGKGGETIKTLQAQTGAVVHIQQDNDPCYITVSGSHPAVEAASSMVEEIARGGSPFRSTTPNPYNVPRPPSMSGYSHPYPPYNPMGPSGSFGYGGGGAAGGFPHHPPANYGYYGNLPGGGYNPQGFPPGPHQMPVPPPPPGQGGYGGGGGGGGYSNYVQQQQQQHHQQQPNPYGQPSYGGQPLTGGSHYSTSAYSQGFAPHLPSESYQQGLMPPPMADGMGTGGTAGGSGHHINGHWTELQDAEGRLYYYNTQTGASQWEKPTDFQ